MLDTTLVAYQFAAVALAAMIIAARGWPSGHRPGIYLTADRRPAAERSGGVWSRSGTSHNGAASEPGPVPGDDQPLDRETAETYARWFQALSDPTRIIILSYLSRRTEPVSVGNIVDELGLGQSLVSHHLKALLAVGFVTYTREGTSRLYSVNHSCITKFPTAADVVMGRSPAPTPTLPAWPHLDIGDRRHGRQE
ncbi:metalloregulator ArsR/SmtB family transcription factor [Polymorphospora rubra]|uniref:ArsR/SmtB family transcription factor n=1 Tax=Polymorphospora rubra TaxID=338584 RepID=UPI0031BB6AD2